MNRNNRRKRKRDKKASLRGRRTSTDATASADHSSCPPLHIDVIPLSNALHLISDQSESASYSKGRQHHDNVDGRRVRIVHPYPYTFATFAKARWIGRTVLDVYVSEFGEFLMVFNLMLTT